MTATVRANARALPETTTRRGALGAIIAAGALASLPSAAAASVATGLEAEPELQALIAAWHETHRRLLETYEASCAAEDRARCPVPQALIATESDGAQTCGPTAPTAAECCGLSSSPAARMEIKTWPNWP